MTKAIVVLMDQPVAYHPILAKTFGGVKAGLLLSQLLYWTPRARDGDGWIYKNADEIREETGMTRREQETARKTLIKYGVIEYKVKGMPAVGHFKVALDHVEALLPEGVIQFQQKRETGLRKSSKPVSTEQPSYIKESEITAETTSESIAAAQPDLSIDAVFEGEYLKDQIRIARESVGRRATLRFSNVQQRDAFDAALRVLNGEARTLIIKGIAKRGSGLSQLLSWLEGCAKRKTTNGHAPAADDKPAWMRGLARARERARAEHGDA